MTIKLSTIAVDNYVSESVIKRNLKAVAYKIRFLGNLSILIYAIYTRCYAIIVFFLNVKCIFCPNRILYKIDLDIMYILVTFSTSSILYKFSKITADKKKLNKI